MQTFEKKKPRLNSLGFFFLFVGILVLAPLTYVGVLFYKFKSLQYGEVHKISAGAWEVSRKKKDRLEYYELQLAAQIGPGLVDPSNSIPEIVEACSRELKWYYGRFNPFTEVTYSKVNAWTYSEHPGQVVVRFNGIRPPLVDFGLFFVCDLERKEIIRIERSS